jgi:hypothetical protein
MATIFAAAAGFVVGVITGTWRVLWAVLQRTVRTIRLAWILAGSPSGSLPPVEPTPKRRRRRSADQPVVPSANA